MDEEKILRAGKIASEIKKWIKPQIKKGMPLLEIAELIENKIYSYDEAAPAFPVNLSINEQAAHYTPKYNDEKTAYGLLKVDFGVHIDGWISDTAFSLDLENSSLNQKLIKSSEECLNNAQKILSPNTLLGEIGKMIEKTASKNSFRPIVNLTGHSIDQYNLHSGLSIPNISNNSTEKIGIGLRAIEPFVTNGRGFVHDSGPSNIYALVSNKNTRLPKTREILNYIKDEFGALPFAQRWIVKKFGTIGNLALKQLEKEGILHHFKILTEEKGKLVAQSENTFLIKKDKVITTTE